MVIAYMRCAVGEDKFMPDRVGSLPRCISVAIGKGGAGKTSMTANVGGLAARAGYRVLIVSLDPQDNMGEDLGYAHVGAGDDGSALVAAIRGEQPLKPLTDVRPGLDVACGGDALEGLVADLYVSKWLSTQTSDIDGPQVDTDHGLARALAPVADTYDLILIDCPPGYHILQHLALVASRWILVPTAADASSRKGIALLANRVTDATAANPDLGLLGVVLFDIPTAATRIRATAATAIAEDLGSREPLMTAFIRTAKAAAADSRERGQLMHELTEALAQQDPWWKRRRQGSNAATVSLAASATTVAADYQALTEEILTQLAAHEEQA